MTAASGVVKRHWAILRMIPVEPRKITARAIAQEVSTLTREKIHYRSIQRDLIKLQEIFPDLICDDRDRTYGWAWRKGSERIEFPAMDGYTALGFRLMELHLKNLLPTEAKRHLQSYFTRATSVLAENAQGALTQWQDLVRIVPRELPRLAPKIPEGVMTSVYDALLEGRKLRVIYQPAAAKRARGPYELNPLGLLLTHHIYYLVATAWDYTDVRHYALHRMQQAEKLEKAAIPLPGFSLDQHLAQGEFEIPVGHATVNLKLRIAPPLDGYLLEAPLSTDQKIEADGSGTTILTASLHDTLELRRWILAQGARVTVLAPKTLRREIRNSLGEAREGYEPPRGVRRQPMPRRSRMNRSRK